MKISIIYKLAALFLFFGMISCGEKNSTDNNSEEATETEEHAENEVMLSAQQFEALQMKIDTLSKRPMSGYVEANGELEVPPQNEAIITAVVGANVTSINVIEGDKVKKGQIVAYLSHPNIVEKQTQYMNAYSNTVFLKKEYERQQKLYNAGVGSGMNFQKAEADYQASISMAKGLEAQLQQLNISTSGVRNGTIYQQVGVRSPIDGSVQSVSVKIGQFVEPQTNMFEIIDTHHVHADLMVFEKDVNRIKEGQTVNFTVQSLPGKELSATIYSISQTFEKGPKAVHVHAEIENKEGDLIPGMYIQGRISVENTVPSIAIPEGAIGKDGDKFYVFSVEKEGDAWSFEPVEIFKTSQDGEWVGINFLNSVAPNTKFAQNNAYYLLAEMKKGSAEHSH